MRSFIHRFSLILLVFALQLPFSLKANAEEQSVPKLLKSCKVGKPVDLLKQKNLLKHAERDEWVFQAGHLSSNPEKIVELYIPYELPEEYIIKADLTRKSGREAFGIGLSMGDSQSTLILDGWSGRFSGLHRLDGKEASFPDNDSQIQRKLFQNGKVGEVQIVVLKQQILVCVDDEAIIDWKGQPTQLSRRPATPASHSRMPFLYSVRTTWSVSRLEVTPLESIESERNLTKSPLLAKQWSIEKELGVVSGQSNRSKSLSDPHREVFYLDLHDPPLDRHRVITGSLLREIGRQSLLLTAREEFGLVTRDVALRDPFPWKSEKQNDLNLKESRPLSVYSLVNHENQALMAIFASGQNTPLWHSQFQVDSDDPYTSFVTHAENFSRGSFIEFLKDRDRTHAPRSWSDAQVPAAIRSQEQTFDVFTQYENIRKLHELIQESGESTARLTSLARCYAHLGELTSTYLSPMSKVFKARALLYAERGVVKSENSPESLWSRAYVRAWCGFPSSASVDIEAAKNNTVEFPPPSWATDLELFCSGKHQELQNRILNDQGSRLSYMLLWFTRKSDENKENVFDSLSVVASQYEDCLHLLLSATMIDSLGAKSTIRRIIPELSPLLKRKLATVPGLPDSVEKLIDQAEPLSYEQIGSIINDLLATGPEFPESSEEISHMLLGQILNEIMMRVTWSAVNYERNSLGISVVDRIEAMKPLVAHHPYRLAIESLAESDELQQYYKARDCFRSIDTLMIEPATFRFIKFFSYVNRPEGERVHQSFAIRHLDESANDLVQRIEWEESTLKKKEFLSRLKTIAPEFPTTIKMRLKLELDDCKEFLPEWEQRFQMYSEILKEISTAYLDTGKIEDAEHCMERCLTIDPSFANAKVYADQALLLGDREKWIARSEEALNYPVLSLEHARIHTDLSNYYLSLDEPDKALHHAEEAASSGAAWTYSQLSDVYTNLKRWDEAELIQRRIVQRYNRSSGLSWFWWCLKTGQGDFQAASEAAKQWYENHPYGVRTDLDKFQKAFYHRTAGEPAEGLRILKSIVNNSHDPYFAWHALILAETLNEPEFVDELLKKIIDWEQSGRKEVYLSGTLRIAQIIQKLRLDGRPGAIELQELDREISTLDNGAPASMWFVLGQYLAYHGREEPGIRYLENAAASPNTNQWDQWLATFYLSQFGRELPPQRESLQIPLESVESLGELDVYQHPSPPTRVDYLNDSDRIITSAQDGIVRIWESGNPKPVSEHDTEGYHFSIDEDGQTISTLHERHHNGTIWNLKSGEKERVYPKVGASMPVLAFSGSDPQRQVIAYYYLLRTGNDRNWHGRLGKYRPESREFQWVHKTGHFHPYLTTFGLDGKELFLALGSHQSLTKFQRLSVESGEILEEKNIPRTRLSRAGMSGDKQYLFTLSVDGELAVRSVQNWRDMFRVIAPGITAASLSSDGSLMAIGFQNGEALLIDGKTGEVHAKFLAHLRNVLQIKFDRTDRSLVTIGDDFTARNWNVRDLLASRKTQAVHLTDYRNVETNSLGMEMVTIPAGSFEMGSTRPAQERPIHTVRIDRQFLLSRFEVTVGQFRTFVEETGYETDAERPGKGGKHLPAPYWELVQSSDYVWNSPGFEQSDDHPVVQVSWNDAREFCKWLSRKEGRVYRLPTEAEWEYACRATSTTFWNFGKEIDNYPSYANIRDVSLSQRYNKIPALQTKSDRHIHTAPVGSYLHNHFGVYDMHGNVREWCSDYYSRSYYENSPAVNPTGPKKGTSRVNRGGSYLGLFGFTRSSHRAYDHPTEARSDLGFRVVCE